MTVRFEGGSRCGEVANLDDQVGVLTYGRHHPLATFLETYMRSSYSDAQGMPVFRHMTTLLVGRKRWWQRRNRLVITPEGLCTYAIRHR